MLRRGLNNEKWLSPLHNRLKDGPLDVVKANFQNILKKETIFAHYVIPTSLLSRKATFPILS